MEFITKKDIKIPKRKPKSHKGDNGKILIIGGSRDYVGAVALAGLAALRAGVDWVTIAVPEKVGWAINALTSDLVVKKLKGDNLGLKHYKKIIDLAKDFDAVLIGNGVGIKKETKSLISCLFFREIGLEFRFFNARSKFLEPLYMPFIIRRRIYNIINL